jgi:hypothetical protein
MVVHMFEKLANKAAGLGEPVAEHTIPAAGVSLRVALHEPNPDPIITLAFEAAGQSKRYKLGKTAAGELIDALTQMEQG